MKKHLFGMERAKRSFAYAIIIPTFIYILLWVIFPSIWVIILSFFDYSPRRSGSWFLGLGGHNPFVGLENFKEMFDFSSNKSLRSSNFQGALKNSLIFSFLVVPLNLCITLPLAVLIYKLKPKFVNNIFRTIIFIPVITSSVGVGIMWKYIFHPQKGLLNFFLSLVTDKFIVINWLNDTTLTFFGINIALFAVILAYLWMDIGYNFIIFIAALQSLPESVLESAELDGASGFQKFFHIILPLLLPQIMLTTILTMISAFQQFDLVMLMTKGGPNNMTRTLVYDIYLNAFRGENMGYASAGAVVFFIIIFIISFIQKKIFSSNKEY